MELAWLIVGMALVTYATRAAPLLFGDRAERLPPWVHRWLRYLPPALFAAVAVPAIVSPAVAATSFLAHPYPWAALASGVLARLTANLTLAMLASILVVLLWRLWLG
ncbi:MAG: AzlD domain-containing protein [Chloroflexi bacterium]|nr:AzlD domain-containing protein [Chloroflexota bacterium]